MIKVIMIAVISALIAVPSFAEQQAPKKDWGQFVQRLQSQRTDIVKLADAVGKSFSAFCPTLADDENQKVCSSTGRMEVASAIRDAAIDDLKIAAVNASPEVRDQVLKTLEGFQQDRDIVNKKLADLEKLLSTFKKSTGTVGAGH
jgi:hypothetical protein